MLAEQVFLGQKDLFCFHENAPGGLKHIRGQKSRVNCFRVKSYLRPRQEMDKDRDLG